MTHPLDRPAWSALTTRQSHLARGEGSALRYDPDYAIFAETPDDGTVSLAALGKLIAATGSAIVLRNGPIQIPPGTRADKLRTGVQMVADTVAPADPGFTFLELSDADAPEMLALATLTEPGPFFTRTNRLGTFIGIRENGRLIAMAGERMKLTGFTEVSGVCTHPDFRGRGLASALMQIVAARILSQGDTPFLHAYAENRGAITLYESLGFRIRCEVTVAVLVPA